MKKDKKWTNQLLGLAKKGVDSIDKDAIKKGVAEKANKAKDAAASAKKEISDKITELDRKLEQSTTEYNNAFTLMNDKGVKLFVERNRAVDTIAFTEELINSIANHPASFDTDFEAIKADRKAFSDSCEFANRELDNARRAAGGAGAGMAGGAAVAMMAPTAAMWVATTFGTASTGAAISSLSGAAATNAALAWLGGGAAAAGGGGMAAGNALLAMAGPIGWTIAGATLLTSIILYSKNKVQLNKEKAARIADIERNTESVKEIDEKLKALLKNTQAIREGVNETYQNCMPCYQKNYADFSSEQKMRLGSLVNETKALSALFRKTIQ
ncbi:MAG: hypothetical protein ACI39G_04935 [Pseudoramibacter sp.]